MRNRLFFTILTLLAFAIPMTASDNVPEVWTLEQCISWAKNHNLTIARNRIGVKQAELSAQNARNAWLPTVNFSSGQNVGYRPFQQSTTRMDGDQIVTTSNKVSYNGSYGISASMPLYDGGVIKNNIALADIDTRIANLTIEQTELSLEEQIISVYVQILYAQETIKQDEEQIELATLQVTRAQALFKSGLLNKADVAQLESQLASDRYQLVADQGALQQYKLQLKQLLELDGDANIEVVTPNLDVNVLAPLPDKNDVYNAAVLYRPELRLNQLNIDRSDINEDIARAGSKPSISVSASSSTGNTSSSGNFFEQLYRQWSNTLGVNISIPIYDHGRTSTAVAQARLERDNYQLAMLDTRKELWKTIETYWLNATTSQQRYIAANERVNYARTSFDLTSEQFRLGLKNIVELATDKANLSNAIGQMLQAKYMAVLNEAMLDYYRGEPIKVLSSI